VSRQGLLACRKPREVERESKARHETINSRLKMFGVLSNVFRHDRDLHQFAFHPHAVITQICFENGSPSFGVNY
jgi:hypothetical protein